MKIPQIYPWTDAQILRRFVLLLKGKLPGLVDDTDPENPVILDELTRTLARVVGYFVRASVLRLNRLPQKVALEFLSMGNQQLLLPSPAQLPVKFARVPGAEVNPFLPQGTQVSTQTNDFSKPVIFETRNSLTVIEPDLSRFIIVDFDQGLFDDKSYLIGQIQDTPVRLYHTDQEFIHKVHIYHPILEELGKDKLYHLQLVLRFHHKFIGALDPPALSPQKAPQLLGGNSFGRDADDPGLFEADLTYALADGTRKRIPVKNFEKGIARLHRSTNDVFFLPIAIDEPISPTRIEGFSTAAGKTIGAIRPFLTLELKIRNREYFNLYAPPNLIEATFRVFYLPQPPDAGLALTEAEVEPVTLAPRYEDIVNIERAFFNEIEIDLSKPFRPFGEQPKLNDTFYFSSLFFGRAGEVCEIVAWLMGDLDGSEFTFESTFDHLPDTPDVQLGWEYFNGDDWVLFARMDNSGNMETGFVPGLSPITEGLIHLPFIDGSRAFTRSAHFTRFDFGLNPGPTIQFRIPDDVRKSVVNDIEDWWLRVRILRGNYGVDVKLDDADPLGFKPATFKAPIFRTFTVNFSGTYSNLGLLFPFKGFPQAPAAQIFTENDFSLLARKDTARGIPATQYEPFPLLELNSDITRNFQNTARAVYIGFQGADVPGKPEALFFTIVPEPSVIVQQEALVEEKDLVTPQGSAPKDSTPALEWSYWSKSSSSLASVVVPSDGKLEAWKSLEVNDRTGNLTSEQSVDFTMPIDADKRVLFGMSLYWVRVVVPKQYRLVHLAKEFEAPLFKQELLSFNEQVLIRGLNQNMVVADSVETIRGELLGSSTGLPSQVFILSSRPVAKGPTILVREADRPSLEEEEVIKATHGPLGIQPKVDLQGAQQIWVRWTEVSEFLGSGPLDRHYVMDHTTGMVTFGDGVHGRIPEAGADSVVAEEYRFGIGNPGNVGVKAVRTLVSAVPYVGEIFNVGEGRGGSNLETADDALTRGFAALRHGDRAVTLEDFETLALEAEAGVVRAKTFAALRPDGLYQRGFVTTAIMVSQPGPAPAPNQDILDRVKRYLSDRAGANLVNRLPQNNPPGAIVPPVFPSSEFSATVATKDGDGRPYLDGIHVVPPNYVRVSTRSSVEFESREAELDGLALIQDRLRSLLHPLTGNVDGIGWDFGEDVREGRVSRAILGVPGVKSLRLVEVLSNQMKFTLPIFSGIEAIEQATIQVTYRSFSPHPLGGPKKDFQFFFHLGRALRVSDDELVLVGFKEGDVLSLKTEANVSNLSAFGVGSWAMEEILNHAKVRSVQPIVFQDNPLNIRMYRLYVEPFIFRSPRKVKPSPDNPNTLEPDGRFSSDSLIVVEAVRNNSPGAIQAGETPPNLTLRSYIKQVHTAEGQVLVRRGEPEFVESTGSDFSRIINQEIVALDIAIPNGWGAPNSQNLSYDILPFGPGVVTDFSENPKFQNQTGKPFDPGRTNAYGTYFESHEYTRQSFFRFNDLPYSGEHVVTVVETRPQEAPETVLT